MRPRAGQPALRSVASAARLPSSAFLALGRGFWLGARGCCGALDFGHAFFLRHGGIGFGQARGEQVKALLHAPDALEQLCIDQDHDGAAVFLDDDASRRNWTWLIISPRFRRKATAFVSVITGYLQCGSY